jgi:hypothetical protein
MSLMMSMIKPLRDVDVESCWRWRPRGDIGRGAMSLSSHVDDGAAESYWRWHCWGDLSTVRCRCRVMLKMVLSRRFGHDAMQIQSHADDGAVKSCWR